MSHFQVACKLYLHFKLSPGAHQPSGNEFDSQDNGCARDQMFWWRLQDYTWIHFETEEKVILEMAY